MAVVQIKIAGTDYTAGIVYATAEFKAQVNGATGTCKFRVRDDARALSFPTGESIELLIDGDPVWTGYVETTSRVYIAPAENVAEAGLTRWLDITGSDLNVLFTRRIVFDPSDGAKVLIPFAAPYPAGTFDTVAIADLVGTYLDLSGDGLDTSTYVSHVGDLDPAQPSRPFSGSNTFGQAMQSIATIPAAVYFIDPARNLVYTDVNTASAPYGLSDVPGPGDAGYREITLTADGTSLVNDYLAWGTGYGSQTPVFDRLTDAPSLALHGRWQAGTLASLVYKQATIDRIADSVVYGSPSSHRGAKDDRTAVTVTTYQPGFLPAQKVNFASLIFGFSDVIPIRAMRVTFDAPDTPKYELTISHAIDSPWGFVDQYLPIIPIPPIPPIIIPGILPASSPGLFSHYVVLDAPVTGGTWAIVAETDPYLQSNTITIPAGLAGPYWFTANLKTNLFGVGNCSVGFKINGLSGYGTRSLGATGRTEQEPAPGHHMGIEFVGVFADGDVVEIETFGLSLDAGIDCQFSAFWLGDKGVAITDLYNITSQVTGYIALDGGFAYNTLGATNQTLGDGVIETTAEGLYLVVNQATAAAFGPEWNVTTDWATSNLTPFAELFGLGTTPIPDAVNPFPTETSYGAYDIVDLSLGNYLTYTASWIGRAPGVGFGGRAAFGAILIPDVANRATSYQDALGNGKSYIAVVRLADDAVFTGARAAGDTFTSIANGATTQVPLGGVISWDSGGYYAEPTMVVPAGGAGLYLIKVENTEDISGLYGPGHGSPVGGWYALDLLRNGAIVASRVYDGYNAYNPGEDEQPWATFVGILADGDVLTMQARNALAGGKVIDTGFDDHYLTVLRITTSAGVAAVTCGNAGDLAVERPAWLGGALLKTRCGYLPNSLRLRRNGLLQRPGTDYTETSPANGLVTLSTALLVTDTVEVSYNSSGS